MKAIGERTKVKPSVIPQIDYFVKKRTRERQQNKIENGKVKNPFCPPSDKQEPEQELQKIKNPFEKANNCPKKFNGFKPGKARSEAIKEAAKEGLSVQQISEKLWIEETVIRKVLQVKHKAPSNIIADNTKKKLSDEFK